MSFVNDLIAAVHKGRILKGRGGLGGQLICSFYGRREMKTNDVRRRGKGGPPYKCCKTPFVNSSLGTYWKNRELLSKI
jgi:hypothetical protein